MKKLIITLQIIVLANMAMAQSWANPQQNAMLYYGSNQNYTVPAFTTAASLFSRPVWQQGGAQLNAFNMPVGLPVFTTNGQTAWDISGGILPNGTGLLGGNNCATPATVIAMDSTTGYLVTTSNITGNNFVYYSRYRTGYLGGTSYLPSIDAIQKNVQLFGTGNANRFLEKATVVRVPGSADFWLILHAINPLAPVGGFLPRSNTISVFKGNGVGISFFANYNLGTPVGFDRGQMKSSDVLGSGCYIAAAYSGERKIDVYNFNASTGIMGLFGIRDCVPLGVMPYGIEFAKQFTYIYFTNRWANNSLGRLDLVPALTPTMNTTITPAPRNGRFGEMQLMGDNNIYFPIRNRSFITQIVNPTSFGPLSGFSTLPVNTLLLSSPATWGIPNFNRI